MSLLKYEPFKATFYVVCTNENRQIICHSLLALMEASSRVSLYPSKQTAVQMYILTYYQLTLEELESVESLIFFFELQ